ncbi:hypothetical protein [Maioricimonas sp. JC845]|uniref:hypothetical protein n=1 Tax=Maioricimonas sp. JC845 TaxID=3232138 RepID=UPI00345A93EE
MAKIGMVVTLGRNVGGLDRIEVDQLEAVYTKGGELQGDWATNGSDPNDGRGQALQEVSRDEIVLTGETVGGCVHGVSG